MDRGTLGLGTDHLELYPGEAATEAARSGPLPEVPHRGTGPRSIASRRRWRTAPLNWQRARGCPGGIRPRHVADLGGRMQTWIRSSCCSPGAHRGVGAHQRWMRRLPLQHWVDLKALIAAADREIAQRTRPFEAARAAGRTKATYLGAQYRRLVPRLGPKRASAYQISGPVFPLGTLKPRLHRKVGAALPLTESPWHVILTLL